VRALAIAAALAAAVVLGGFGLERIGLPRAGKGNEAAAKAAEWLLRYRLTSSSFDAGGRVLRGHCLHGWFDGPNGRDEHGTELVLGGLTADGRNGLAVAARGPTLAVLELAGCPDVLGPKVASYAIAGTVSRALVGNVLALGLGRMRLLVAAHSDRPLGVALGDVRSTLRLTPMTPALARRLGAG